MANSRVCLLCGVSGVSKDLVNCVNCCAYSIHRYCMIEWPKTKRGSVHWVCGCQEVSNQSISDQSDEQVSNQSEQCGFVTEEEEANSSSKTFVIHPESKTNVANLSSSSGTKPIRKQRVLSKFMKSFTSYGKLYGPNKKAEPIIISIWSGSFEIRLMQSTVRKLNGMTAFLSNKADKKAWEKTVEFDPIIRPEMVLKDSVWPNCFQETAPKDEDLAVYFFSSLGVDQQVYDCLVFEMIRDDLAMRIEFENAEILIFTSVDLIPRLRKFQGQWYLWGFFRQKHCSNDEHHSLSGPDLSTSC